jgi:hypothetical protein
VREASPAAATFANAGMHTSSIPEKVANSTHAISTVGSMNDLIATVPSRFRTFIAPILRDMQDVHGKYCNAEKALHSLKAHQTAGTWPTFIAGMHNPFSSIQVTKESKATLADPLKEANTWFTLQKEEALSRVIALKQAEVTHLKKQCSPPVVQDLLLAALKEDQLSCTKELGKFTEATPGVGIKLPTWFENDYVLAQLLAPIWTAKVLDFTRIKSQKLSKELEKKIELAAEARSEMDGVEYTATPELQKTIKDAVDAALRQKNEPASNLRK